MLKTLGILAGGALLLYALACLALFLLQRSLIYFPPRAAALDAPASTILHVPGAALKVSERPAPGRPALIYLGGNAEDVSTSLPELDAAFPGHALYLLHYRGFPGSTGEPSEAALVADALALFDRVAAGHPEVLVLGRSLGSGVAVQVAARRPVARLILVTPFDSLAALAAKQFPWVPTGWLLRDRYDSGAHAARVKAPTLIIAAAEDEIVPLASSRLLLSRFPAGVASMEIVADAGHNTISGSPRYQRLLSAAPSPRP
ncbi:hypothetical protein B0920_06605 [Massilia sp. KIM]|uniref:alpha/beta hydrolase n=1 Tax=Massilia sp. KIM TaxID=1955422 RepID=UPI00098F6682|nr:alpha/beta fold hydrolase [Massilia sp. KIM]OON64653.1 hypothetical protein B0920_06605 [Massilia sp. KIM]